MTSQRNQTDRNVPEPWKSELYEAVESACDGAMTPAQVERLGVLLAAHPEAAQLYVRCLYAQSLLEHLDEFDSLSQRKPDQGTGIVIPHPNDAVPGLFGSWPVGPSGLLLGLAVFFLLTIGGMVALSMRDLGDRSVARSVSSVESAANKTDQAADHSPSLARPPSVARLTRAVGCRWNGIPADAMEPGTPLTIGQSLPLVEGVVEIEFDAGARVILQGPAAFHVESRLQARLDGGKATVEIREPAARGFQICTPDATFVDQGTEFGVDVAPSGRSVVHVFQGEVEFSLAGKKGAAGQSQVLRKNRGARLEDTVMLYEDTGEAFIRSMEQADRDRHVVAYWRFEDQPIGVIVPDTKKNSQATRVTVDSSYNGNDLFAYTPRHAPRFSAVVPCATVAQSGTTNRSCLDTTEPPENEPARELYTRSAFSHAAPIDIQKAVPVEWTLEASVKVKRLRHEAQTFLGRDGDKDHAPPLKFQVNEHDRFAISFVDGRQRRHEAVATELPVEENRWYNLAATSDGRVLKLYVDRFDGGGYRLQASTNLPQTGSTAMGKVMDEGYWTIGRGRPWDPVRKWFPGEWFQGWIDEVRVSDVALEPEAFLFSAAAELSRDNSESTPIAGSQPNRCS